MDRTRIALALLLVTLAACATPRHPDPFKDRIRACGTVIGTCGSVVW